MIELVLFSFEMKQYDKKKYNKDMQISLEYE